MVESRSAGRLGEPLGAVEAKAKMCESISRAFAGGRGSQREAQSLSGPSGGRCGGPAKRFAPLLSGPPQVAYRNGGSETGQGPVTERPRREWGESREGCGVARRGGRTGTGSASGPTGMTGAAIPRRTACSASACSPRAPTGLVE
jgi:hypothetical protein